MTDETKTAEIDHGPLPLENRLWLAAKLKDDHLSHKEAFSIVAFHPDIKAHWLPRSQRELEDACKAAAALEAQVQRLEAENAPMRAALQKLVHPWGDWAADCKNRAQLLERVQRIAAAALTPQTEEKS